MLELLSWLLTVLAAVIALPVAVLSLEILAAVWGPKRMPISNGKTHPRVAALVPAHNESAALIPTLQDIKAQLGSKDRLIVIADNCSDDTAQVARAAGAEVIERNDLDRIGKGYALDWGVKHLEVDPPDVVLVVDADCRLGAGALDTLAAACASTGRPAQALYLMSAPKSPQINQQIAEFAWRVKNWVRPLGLAALNQPCQLMGAGVATPWDVIRSVDLADGSIVEDLKLGLDLTLFGHPPLFCPSALVKSEFPTSAQGAKSQRKRWEQGHIAMILDRFPRLILSAVTRRSLSLLALTLDLSVPPLALLTILVGVTFLMSATAALLGLSPIALIVSVVTSLVFFFSVLIAWWTFGRDTLPLRALFSIPAYIMSKLGIYRQALSGRMTGHWVRTDRTSDADPKRPEETNGTGDPETVPRANVA